MKITIKKIAKKTMLALCVSGLLAGCATSVVKKEELVWPEPPQTARIKFVTGLRSRDDLPKEKSFAEKFQETAFGSNDLAVLYQPSGLAISDDTNRLYVADWVRGYVVVFDFEHSKTYTIGGPDTPKPLASTYSVALDSAENVYALDQGAKMIRVYDKSGKYLRDITAFGAEPFERITGLAVDKVRNLLYVADSSHVASQNHRIYVFSTDGKFQRYIGKRGTGDGEFNSPTFLYVDDSGTLHVCDSLNFRIQLFAPDGTFKSKFGERGDAPGYFAKIKGVAKDTFGNFYVADGGSSTVTLFNAKYQPLLFFGGLSAKPGYFQAPTAVAIDRNNKIYVVDTLSARVNVYQLVNTSATDSFLPVGPVKAEPGKQDK